jgi:hypothetical protein
VAGLRPCQHDVRCPLPRARSTAAPHNLERWVKKVLSVPALTRESPRLNFCARAARSAVAQWATSLAAPTMRYRLRLQILFFILWSREQSTRAAHPIHTYRYHA